MSNNAGARPTLLGSDFRIRALLELASWKAIDRFQDALILGSASNHSWICSRFSLDFPAISPFPSMPSRRPPHYLRLWCRKWHFRTVTDCLPNH